MRQTVYVLITVVPNNDETAVFIDIGVYAARADADAAAAERREVGATVAVHEREVIQ